MSMTKKICVVLCFAVWAIPSMGAEPTAAADSVGALAARLSCPCTGQMTLADCERENPTCTVRPVLVRRMEEMARDGAAEETIVETLAKHVAGEGERALCQARQSHRFLMLFFYEEGSDKSKQMAEVVNQAERVFHDRGDVARVNINDSREAQLVRTYGIWRAPLLLVIAPNGVVTRAFQEPAPVSELAKAFVSAKTVEIIGALQQRKVVFLLVQNDGFAAAAPNRQAAQDVAEVLSKSVAVHEVDPRDDAERDLLKQLKVAPDVTDAVTVAISPNGVIADRLAGQITSKDLFNSYKKVLAQKSGCGAGCGGGQ